MARNRNTLTGTLVRREEDKDPCSHSVTLTHMMAYSQQLQLYIGQRSFSRACGRASIWQIHTNSPMLAS